MGFPEIRMRRLRRSATMRRMVRETAPSVNMAIFGCILLGIGAMCLNTVGNTLIPVVLFGIGVLALATCDNRRQIGVAQARNTRSITSPSLLASRAVSGAIVGPLRPESGLPATLPASTRRTLVEMPVQDTPTGQCTRRAE